MDADERPTDDTPLPPTGWMDSENQPVPYRTQHTKEGSLRLSNYMSVSYFPTFHQMPTNEIPTSPSMSTPSLSPLQSVGSSSSQSSAMTTPTSSLARPPPVPPKSSVSKFPYSVDERKVPEQPRRPPLVQLPTVEQNKELETWLLSHMSYPCPTHEEQQRLARCTGLSVHQVVTWLSRARSRKLTQNSPFQKCPPTTTPVLEEHASQSSLQCSSLTIEVGGERISPQSFSTIPEPKASENSGASTYVAPPTVSGESITSSLSVLVHAVDIVERLNRTKPSKLDEAASPLISVIPAATSRPSLRDTIDKQSGGGINMEYVV
jgi:Homeobox KN domain